MGTDSSTPIGLFLCCLHHGIPRKALIVELSRPSVPLARLPPRGSLDDELGRLTLGEVGMIDGDALAP